MIRRSLTTHTHALTPPRLPHVQPPPPRGLIVHSTKHLPWLRRGGLSFTPRRSNYLDCDTTTTHLPWLRARRRRTRNDDSPNDSEAFTMIHITTRDHARACHTSHTYHLEKLTIAKYCTKIFAQQQIAFYVPRDGPWKRQFLQIQRWFAQRRN